MRKKPKILSLLGLREIFGKTLNFLGKVKPNTYGKYYDLIVEYSTDWIYLTDKKGDYLYVSSPCETITGYKPHEFITDKELLKKIAHPDDLRVLESHFKEVLYKEDEYEVEFRIISKAKKIVWIGHKCRPVFNDMGNYIGRRGTNRDITEHKIMQEELRESKTYNRKLFEKSPVGLALTTIEGQLLDVNSAFASIVGRTIEEIKGLRYSDISPKKFLGQEEDKIKELEKTGHCLPFEREFIHKDGHIVDVRIQGLIIEKDGIRNILSSIEDISVQKKAIEEQTASLELLNNLASQVPGVVYQYRLYKDGKSAFPFSSPGMWGIYEVTPEEVQFDASPVFTRLHPDDHDYIVRTIMESAENLTNYESEFRVILPQQGLRWRHCNAKPERMDDGSTLWHGIITDITQRKMAETSLRESEERFRAIVEGAPDPIFIQTGHNFAYLNKPALELFGVESESDIIGSSVVDHFHPDFLEKIRERIRLLNEERKSVSSPLEQILIRKNGEELWVETTGEPILYNGKQGGLVFLRDISQRKIIEEKLAQSHKLMSYIIEHDHNAIVVFNKNMEYIYVSQHYLRVFNLENSNIIGKNHYDIFPNLSEKWKNIHQRSLKGEVFKVDEDSVTHPDGSVDWSRWECRPWYESDGSIGGIVIYSELITDRKQKELEIQKLNQKLEILIDSIQKLSSAQSIDSVQTIVTKSARQLIGADGATIVFKENGNCYYVDEDAIAPLWKGKRFPFKSCISGWVMDHREAVTIVDIYNDDRIPKDLYSKTFVKSMAMVPIMINEPIGAIGTYWQSTYKPNKNDLQLLKTLSDAAARSIENIKLYTELEERVKLRTEQLRSVNKELETFTYSVSHDLKAPLRGIDGYSKLLQDEYGDKLGDEAAHFIRTIRSSTLQMNTLIEDLLKYSRLERTDFKQEKIALKPYVEILTNNYRDEFKIYGFSVVLDVPDAEIIADSTGLSIILRNFIENAIKFTKGRPNPAIKVSFGEKTDGWVIEVKDNGVGFDMKYHDRIFEIFQRLHLSEDFPGTGIGLAMVAKAAKRMGGQVWATSVPGEGSSFFVEIPKNSSI